MKTITSAQFQNFTSFGNARQEIELSQLTCIIGANGSGKTNLLRGIWLAAIGMHAVMETDMVDNTAVAFTQKDFRHIGSDGEAPTNSAHPLIEMNLSISDGSVIQRAYNYPRSNWDEYATEETVNVEFFDTLALFRDDPPYSRRIAFMLARKGLLDQAAEIYEEISNSPFPFTYNDKNITQPTDLRYVDVRQTEHLSAGQRNFLDLVMTLVNPINNDVPLLIDLPETSLHLGQQRLIGELIADSSRRRQIIVSTHSPEIVAALYGQRFVSCKIENGETTCVPEK